MRASKPWLSIAAKRRGCQFGRLRVAAARCCFPSPEACLPRRVGATSEWPTIRPKKSPRSKLSVPILGIEAALTQWSWETQAGQIIARYSHDHSIRGTHLRSASREEAMLSDWGARAKAWTKDRSERGPISSALGLFRSCAPATHLHCRCGPSKSCCVVGRGDLPCFPGQQHNVVILPKHLKNSQERYTTCRSCGLLPGC